MRADDDPLLPPHWLAELGDGLGEPLLRSLWNSPAPEPVASAPANANLTVRWQHNQPPEFVVPPIALRMGPNSSSAEGGQCSPTAAAPAVGSWWFNFTMKTQARAACGWMHRTIPPNHKTASYPMPLPKEPWLPATSSATGQTALTAMAGAQANRLLARRQHRRQADHNQNS